jgi:hypothetical protein
MHQSEFAPGNAMPRTLFAAFAFVVAFAGLAQAQVTGPIPNSGFDPGGINWAAWPIIKHERIPEDAGREYEIERKYRETLKTKIPDRRLPNDPWRTVRPAPRAAPVDRHKVY